MLVCLIATACGRLGFDAAPEPQRRWVHVRTSGLATCAITDAGELWCWGSGAAGNLGNGAAVVQPVARVGAATDWIDVAVGRVVTCGLRSGDSLWCWGTNELGAIPGAQPGELVVSPTQIAGAWRAVRAAGKHACAIDASGVLSCWGEGGGGTLGDGQVSDRAQPTPVGAVGTSRWTALDLSAGTTCGIQSDASLWCWGRNTGDGTQQQRNAPVQIGAGMMWSAVATGDDQTCALEQGGQAWCWGGSWFGQLGDNNVASMTVPAPVRSTVIPPLASITAGRGHVCGYTLAGDAQCWGNGERGQLGATIPISALPVTVATAPAQIVAGGDVTCIVDGNAALACTGGNNYGQAGGDAAIGLVPAPRDARTDWARVVAMNEHACGVTAAGGVHCWGLNHEGELGNGDHRDRAVPIDTAQTYTTVALGGRTLAGIPADGSLWLSGLRPDLVTRTLAPAVYAGAGSTKQVALGDRHVCRILANDTLSCGGDNTRGQLGDGTTVAKESVSPAGTWQLIAAGSSTTCGVTSTNVPQCWGRNDAGQLGIGTTVDARTPQPVMLPAGAAVVHLAIGFNFTCAITLGGELWCWGAGDVGQLGRGTLGGSTTPVRVGSASNWARVAAGDAHACALTTTNQLWCWGRGDEGQAGPELGNHAAPVQIGGPEWRDVAAGARFTCAVKLDGTRWCFGTNQNGELGTGTGWREQFIVIP